MSFQISGLPAESFRPLFDLSDEELASQGARRVTANAAFGFPCRVSLQDAEKGDELILLNYEHLPIGSAYRSRHAIFVRKGVDQYIPKPDEVPDVLAQRLLSVRGFGNDGFIRDADVVEGTALSQTLERLFDNDEIDFIHIHNAKHGCFAASAKRA